MRSFSDLFLWIACYTSTNKPLNKDEYYRRETFGAPLVDTICFRCPKRLGVFLRTQAIIEGKGASAVIRRMVTQQCQVEGYDPDGC